MLILLVEVCCRCANVVVALMINKETNFANKHRWNIFKLALLYRTFALCPHKKKYISVKLKYFGAAVPSRSPYLLSDKNYGPDKLIGFG